MAYTTHRVKIEYCVSCGYLPQAIQLSQDVLQHLRMDIEAVELLTTDSGIFDVMLDDELIFSRFDEGRFPSSKEIIQKVREKVRI